MSLILKKAVAAGRRSDVDTGVRRRAGCLLFHAESAMRRGNWIQGSIVGAIFALGCGSQSRPESTASEPELLLCQEYTLINAFGEPYQEHERYMLPAINRTLSFYPELVDAVGLDHVSTCDEARTFMREYGSYSAAHPGFDAYQPRDHSPPADPGPYPGPAPTLELPKILNASAVFNYPVVRIANNRNSTCTGYFVAKNWIATAAHCLSYSGTDVTVKTKPISDYYAYRIDRPDSTAATLGKIYAVAGITGKFLQYPDPDWKGWDPMSTANKAAFDFGLLYLEPANFDPILPPSVSNSALRISDNFPTTTDTLTFFGWGPNTWTKSTNAVGPTDTLRTGTFVPTTASPDPLLWTVPASTSMRPCIGDSGGPAAISTTVAGASQWVVMAELGGNLTDTTEKCAEAGDSLGFPRMFSESTFIEETMRIWQGRKFQCIGFPFAGSSGTDYLRCWGNPCSKDTDCVKDTEVCRGLVASKPNIKGQCLKKDGLTSTN